MSYYEPRDLSQSDETVQTIACKPGISSAAGHAAQPAWLITPGLHRECLLLGHCSHETASHAQPRSCQHVPSQVQKTCLHCWQSLLVLANQQSFRCSFRRVPSYTLSLSDQFSARETPISTLSFQRSAHSCTPRREQHGEDSRPTSVHCTPGTRWHSTGLAPGWPGSLPGICTLCFHPGWSPQQPAGSEGRSSWCNSPWHQIPRCILKRRTKLKNI